MPDNFTATPVKGLKTHNSGAPGNTNVGTLPAIATNVAPAFTEGNQTGLSVDLAGNLRVTMAATGTQTVALDAASLSALENITATLDAASLAALESITIGTALPAGDNNIGNVDIVTMPAVALDAATLTALETITVGGTVALDTATLTALENTTVTVGNASIAVTGPLTDAQLRATPVPVDISDTTLAVTQSGAWTVDVSDAGFTVTNAAGASAVNIQDGGNSITVDGSVSISNFPGTQAVSGTVEIGATSLAALETITISNTAFGITGALPAGTNNIGDVDVLTLPAVTQGTAAALTAPWTVRLSDGAAALGTATNPLVVTSGQAAGTIVDSGLLTTANVAAGASTTFNSTAIATGTPRLIELTASASVRIRVELQTFNGTTATPRRVFFVEANQSFVYTPADYDAITMPAGAGVTYRLVVTNWDNNSAADVYASLTWSS